MSLCVVLTEDLKAFGHGVVDDLLNGGNIVDKPYMFCDVKILKGDGMEAIPGEVGEVWGKSLGMFSGYINNSQCLENGWHATGDMMYRDEKGNLHFVDRKKDMIKSGGENIYSAEVEDALLEHDAVAECAVFGLPDPFYTEIVAAAVVLRAGVSVSETELIEFCRTRIASYKKPRKLFFVDSMSKSEQAKYRNSN